MFEAGSKPHVLTGKKERRRWQVETCDREGLVEPLLFHRYVRRKGAIAPDDVVKSFFDPWVIGCKGEKVVDRAKDGTDEKLVLQRNAEATGDRGLSEVSGKGKVEVMCECLHKF